MTWHNWLRALSYLVLLGICYMSLRIVGILLGISRSSWRSSANGTESTLATILARTIWEWIIDAPLIGRWIVRIQARRLARRSGVGVLAMSLIGLGYVGRVWQESIHRHRDSGPILIRAWDQKTQQAELQMPDGVVWVTYICPDYHPPFYAGLSLRYMVYVDHMRCISVNPEQRGGYEFEKDAAWHAMNYTP
jgi:hypothetical protein